MNKIILTIFFLLFAVIYDTRYSFAQQALPESDKYPNDSWIEEIPVICNDTTILHNFLESKGWKLILTYTGRVAAEPTGAPVFIVAHYKNNKLPKLIIETITVPSGESCLLYQGFDEKPLK